MELSNVSNVSSAVGIGRSWCPLLSYTDGHPVRVDDLRRSNKTLELMNANEKIPVEYFPLAAPPSCFATEHERFWRERVSNSLSPPRHKQLQYQLQMKEKKEAEEESLRRSRMRSPGMSIYSPKVRLSVITTSNKTDDGDQST